MKAFCGLRTLVPDRVCLAVVFLHKSAFPVGLDHTLYLTWFEVLVLNKGFEADNPTFYIGSGHTSLEPKKGNIWSPCFFYLA